MNDPVTSFAINFIAFVGIAFLVIFIIAVGVAFTLYQIDKHQTAQTIRRNYPLIGRFRYMFEHVGSFSASISSPWTVRRCHLTVRSAPGCIVQLKM